MTARVVFLLSPACCVAVILTLLFCYRRRRVPVEKFAQQATRGVTSQRDAVFALGRSVFSTVQRTPQDPLFLSRFLAPLGASPAAVLEWGGCCSGIHRLFIASLDTLGISSAQVTVFRRVAPALAHCLTQVNVGTEKLLLDVDYGLWLRHPDGSPVDVLALRRGVVPVLEPFVADARAPYRDSDKSRGAGYPDRDYYRFNFEVTRTANWAESALKRRVYAVLHPLTRGRIDLLFLPPILEWPEVLLSIVLAALAVAVLLCGLLVRAL